MTRRKLERRFRIVLAIFMLALVLSGITAFPLLTEVRFLAETLGVSADAGQQHSEGLGYWIGYVHEGLEESYENYPFIAYGTDWLAFAHIVIAVFFVGPLLRPTEYNWTLVSGMIACVGVLFLALICGPMRGIPLYWRLIDCSFGVFGFLPLAYCYVVSRKLNSMRGSPSSFVQRRSGW
jgi:hypothetical protein